MASLIAGYDPETVTDEAGLTAFVGANTLYVAGLVLAVAVVEYAEPFSQTAADAVRIGFVVGVLALAARMVVGARRYEDSG
ncbi:DUF3784 domain-containing protein [Salinadaptatus halalkaliphilus]|uniref:DUF3784 domain-containing protein n=1 Tax=Salinadaptatus halalkaliphilus TaxID=2419781 RepID=A0A4S3TID8_9EURY|nr:DUF3784 domain-containing protein [Salinadaptatus halalkaliphilus]